MKKPGSTYSLEELMVYFLKLGCTGFGGPAALVAYMHRDLVEEKKWLSEEDYKEGLALAQLAPGPLAAQLAIYIGYVDYKILGATLVGLAFVLPSFVMVVLLGIAYVQFGGLTWIQAVFYGIGPAVIGIIAMSSWRLIKKTVGKDVLTGLIVGVLAVITVVTEREILWLMLLAGFVVWFARIKIQSWKKTSLFVSPVLLQVVHTIQSNEKLVQMGWFFLKAGAFVFGSGLAIVPFLYGGVVKDFHWLNEHQFLDAVAVAMITPGPVVITVGFIGYLVAGFPGACVAALGTFLPCYVFTIVPAPFFRKWGRRPGLKAFIDGITAAAIGAIAGAVLVLAKRQFTDITSVLIAVITIILLIRFRQLKEPFIILLAAIAGLLIRYLM